MCVHDTFEHVMEAAQTVCHPDGNVMACSGRTVVAALGDRRVGHDLGLKDHCCSPLRIGGTPQETIKVPGGGHALNGMELDSLIVAGRWHETVSLRL